jgi:hypothetical protein
VAVVGLKHVKCVPKLKPGVRQSEWQSAHEQSLGEGGVEGDEEETYGSDNSSVTNNTEFGWAWNDTNSLAAYPAATPPPRIRFSTCFEGRKNASPRATAAAGTTAAAPARKRENIQIFAWLDF